MIDVPVRVKEALRDGGYRKNYRIDVLKGNNQWEHYGEISKGDGVNDGKLILRENGKYKLNFENLPTFTFKPVLKRSGGEELFQLGNADDGYSETVRAAKNDYFEVYFRFNDSDGNMYTDGSIIVEVLKLNENPETDFTITNDNLVDGTVRLDERMNSGDEFKFGLCEGSSIEFEYFGFDNIKNRNIKITLDVQYKDENAQLQWYSIPMGFYTVDTCQRQASTGIFKVTGYNNLKSKYLDAKANKSLVNIANNWSWGRGIPKTLDALVREALDGYEVKAETKMTPVYNIGLNYDWRNIQHPYTYRWTEYDDSGNPTGYVIDYMTADWGIDFAERNSNDNEYYMRLTFDMTKFYDNAHNNCHLLDAKISSDGKTINDVINANIKLMYHLSNRSNDVQYEYGDESETNPLKMKGYYDSGYVLISKFSVHSTFYDYYCILRDSGALPDIALPVWFYRHATSDEKHYITAEEREQARQNAIAILSNMDISLFRADTTRMGAMTIENGNDIAGWADVTLRQLKGALLETEGLIGNVGRTDGLFNGVTVNRGHLLPSDALYPNNSLLPTSDAEHPQPSSYSTLWLEDGNVQTIKYLIITYKGLDGDGNEKEYKLQRTVNTHGTTNYNMSDNWLFRNLVWTAEQVAVYADLLVEKLRPIKWTPFELWGAGLPYLEVGDEIEVATKEHSYTSYIFQRQLKGIQNLEDNYVNGQLDIY